MKFSRFRQILFNVASKISKCPGILTRSRHFVPTGTSLNIFFGLFSYSYTLSVTVLTLWVAPPNVTSMEICLSINFNKLRAQHIMKTTLFLRFLTVSFDHLFDNLESRKYINKSFGKTSGKVLNFGSKNLYESRTQKG